jgi:bacteriophage protein GP30.3
MTQRILHKLKINILCRLGLAIDIHSSRTWPSHALSNLYPHKFEFDGMKCGSMEGFLQAIKTNDPNRQEMVCSLCGKKAKMRSTDTWKKEQNVYWKGHTLNRHGNHFQFLIRRAFRAMATQSPDFRKALLATDNKKLYHTIGKDNPQETILTEQELCSILTDLRADLRKAYKDSR